MVGSGPRSSLLFEICSFLGTCCLPATPKPRAKARGFGILSAKRELRRGFEHRKNISGRIFEPNAVWIRVKSIDLTTNVDYQGVTPSKRASGFPNRFGDNSQLSAAV
jgi:hypothetical protein